MSGSPNKPDSPPTTSSAPTATTPSVGRSGLPSASDWERIRLSLMSLHQSILAFQDQTEQAFWANPNEVGQKHREQVAQAAKASLRTYDALTRVVRYRADVEAIHAQQNRARGTEPAGDAQGALAPRGDGDGGERLSSVAPGRTL